MCAVSFMSSFFDCLNLILYFLFLWLIVVVVAYCMPQNWIHKEGPIFRDVTPCCWVSSSKRLEGSSALICKVKQSCLVRLLNSEDERTRFFKTPAAARPMTQCHIPTDLNLQQHHFENLKSCNELRMFRWHNLPAWVFTIHWSIAKQDSAPVYQFQQRLKLPEKLHFIM